MIMVIAMNSEFRFFMVFVQCEWRSLLIGFSFVSIFTVGLVLLTDTAYAESHTALVQLDEVTQGSLLVKSDGQQAYVETTLLSTDVDIRINGLVAKTILTQSFKNTSQEWIEGIYVFPLSEKAAVHRYRIQIGERVIEGVIKEKQAAKKAYAIAKSSGKRAALIEQERPNLFTNSIANIGPGETVSVTLEYQEVVSYQDQTFSLRFPMAITPRYILGQPLSDISEELSVGQGTGWALDTAVVPDASRITPSYASHSHFQPVSINIELNAGIKLSNVLSRYHPVQIQRGTEGKAQIQLQHGTTQPDKDFVLEWMPTPTAAPRAALFQEMNKDSNENFGLMMLMPPTIAQHQLPSMKREMIFVIDTSGSMGGASIRQARQSLEMAVNRLKPTDRFNIIEFNSGYSSLFSQPVMASHQNTQSAIHFVSSLQAGGGTEMYSALDYALNQSTDNQYIRQLVFLTDGAVGNETQLFKLIENKLNGARLFTIGIGSAPNSYFMTRAAKFGRGSYTYIGNLNEVSKQMLQLFSKLETPVMTQLHIDWPDNIEQQDVYPQRLPDLYAGEPLLVYFKSSNLVTGNIQVSGSRATQKWESAVKSGKPITQAGLDVLWARQKVESLMDELQRGANPDDIKQRVTKLGLNHHLVTKYTSMVAIDKTPVRPVTDKLKSKNVAGQLPQGMTNQQQLLAMPQTATNFQIHLTIGFLLLLWAVYWGWCSSRRKTPQWMSV